MIAQAYGGGGMVTGLEYAGSMSGLQYLSWSSNEEFNHDKSDMYELDKNGGIAKATG
jgi:hypothetical protein